MHGSMIVAGKEMWPTLVAQMNWFLARRTQRGLLLAREYSSFDNPFAYITCEGATVNAYFYDALKVANNLAILTGDKEKATLYQRAAEVLKVSFNQQFWNETEKAYNSAFLKDKMYAPTVHAQLIALHYGLPTPEKESDIKKWFLLNYKNPGGFHCCTNNDFEKMVEMKAGINMPVMYYWVFSELYRSNTEAMDKEAMDEMLRRWTPQVNYKQDVGTLSESFTDENGEGASQSCHNYGAVPAYFLSSYVLGVRRSGNVLQKQLIIEPRLADLTFANGTVVTEFGTVNISWQKSLEGKSLSFNISIPKGINVELHLPILSENNTLILNKKVLVKDGIPTKEVSKKSRWYYIPKVSGEVEGILRN